MFAWKESAREVVLKNTVSAIRNRISTSKGRVLAMQTAELRTAEDPRGGSEQTS